MSIESSLRKIDTFDLLANTPTIYQKRFDDLSTDVSKFNQ